MIEIVEPSRFGGLPHIPKPATGRDAVEVGIDGPRRPQPTQGCMEIVGPKSAPLAQSIPPFMLIVENELRIGGRLKKPKPAGFAPVPSQVL